MPTWVYPPNMHHGSMESAPAQPLAYSAVHENKKPSKDTQGSKKALSWVIGDVVTVTNAAPQPDGHDPARRSTPPSGMDADHCYDAPSKCESNQEKDHLFSPYPNQWELGSTKPCALVGRTQPTTPAGWTGRSMSCNPAVSKVNPRCSPGTVRCTYSDCAEPSMTKRRAHHPARDEPGTPPNGLNSY